MEEAIEDSSEDVEESEESLSEDESSASDPAEEEASQEEESSVEESSAEPEEAVETEEMPQDPAIRQAVEEEDYEEVMFLTAGAASSTTLQDFTKGVSINGLTPEEDGSYKVLTGKEYDVAVSFAENNDQQFDDYAMSYTVPDGFTPNAGTYTLDIVCNAGRDDEFTVSGNTYVVDENGNITFTWNRADENYEKLAGMSNAEFKLQLKGTFSADASQLDFGKNVTLDLDVNDGGEVSVSKDGYYDKETNTMIYTVKVSSEGTSQNVVVSDTMGSGLIFASSTLSCSPDLNGSLTSSTDGSFTYTIPSMTDGQTATLTYRAVVDTEKLTGKGTTEQLGNTVKVTSTGDPDGDEATKEVSGVDYTGFSKSSGASEYSEDGNTKYTKWTVTYNEGYGAPLSGKTITDTLKVNGTDTTIDSDKGVTVGVYDSYKQQHYEDSATISADGQSFTYAVDEAYQESGWYLVFTYWTKTDVSEMLDDTTISNKVTDDTFDKEVSATVGPEDNNKIAVTKSAQSVSSTEIVWQVNIDVPAKGLSTAVVTDTLPATNYWADGVQNYKNDTINVDDVTIEGLGETEDANITINDNKEVVITFYQDKDHTKAGLAASDAKRTITITYKTAVDQDWLKDATDGKAGKVHTNNVTYTADSSEVKASAEATPVNQTLTKSGGQAQTASDGTTYYRYELKLTGVSGDITINDTFDTEKLEYYASPNDAGHIYGGNEWYQGSDAKTTMTKTDTDTGISLSISADNLAMDGDVYYGYYRVVYYLAVKSSAKEELDKTAAENDGSVTLSNTATWNAAEGSADVTYAYKGEDKELLNANQIGGTNRTANYRITANEGANRVNGGETYTLTDTFSANQSVKYTTISIKDAEGNKLEGVTYNVKGQTITFYNIPDETSVVITYSTRVIGSGSQTLTNKAEYATYEDTASKTANFESSGGGTASDAVINIIKVDSELSSTTLEGAVFELYEAASDTDTSTGTKVATTETLTTDTNGLLTLKGGTNGNVPTLKYDTRYYLVETKAPKDYVKSTIHYSFKISSEADYDNYIYYDDDTMQIRNTKGEETPVGSLKVTKTTSGNTTPDDAVFTVKNADGDEVASFKYSEMTDGVYTVTDLEPGTYTVTESDADIQGWTLTVTGQDTETEVKADETAEVTLTNTYSQDLGSLLIVKITNYNTTPDDALFTITSEDGKVVRTCTYKDMTAGDYEFKDLPVGKYTVTESNAEISGWDLVVEGNNQTVEVTKGNEVKANLRNTYSQITGSLKVTKTTSGNTTPDTATFSLVNDDGTKIASFTYKDMTDGVYTVENLPIGKYVLSESGASIANWSLDITGNDQWVTITKDQTAEATITNTYSQVKVSAKISKVEVGAGTELPGASLTLLDSQNNVIKTWTSTEEPEEITDLIAGETYTLRETVAPEGYAITTDTTFTLKADGTVDPDKTTAKTQDGIILVEDSKTSVQISKVEIGAG